jgi:hypothetical protein
VLKTLGKRLEPACYARELGGLTRRSGEGHECLGRNAGSLVLTTFGRSNAGTGRGDQEIADRYLNLLFRI